MTRLPDGATLLASNAHTRVQALEVRYLNGVFWATQYHPEYDLLEMARLIAARAEALIREGFFANAAVAREMVDRLEALARDPGRKDLRWALAIDDDLLDERLRSRELRNWLDTFVRHPVTRLA